MILYENRVSDIYMSFSNGSSFPPHLHRNLELLICIEGMIEVSCCAKTYTLKKGVMMVALPNKVHSYRELGKGKFIMVTASPDMLPALKKYFSLFCNDCIFDAGQKLIDYSEDMIEEYNGDCNKEILSGYLYIILGEAFKTFSFENSRFAPFDNVFTHAMQYISENYTQSISLKSVASKIGVNHCHLSRLFYKNLSCSFLYYLHGLRIAYAEHLLVSTDYSIAEIAFECGFSSIRTFNRVFLQFTGDVPKKYRKEASLRTVEKNEIS